VLLEDDRGKRDHSKEAVPRESNHISLRIDKSMCGGRAVVYTGGGE